MTDFPSPLRLAVGSHEAGSGRGCAMNVISWESGDKEITDLPACADPFLARVVQNVNDQICTHRDGKLLCSPCSVMVLPLAHRTVGTALVDWSDADRQKVYVRIALAEADSVGRPDEDARVTACREAVRRWLDGKATIEEVRKARSAAYAYAYAADAAYADDAAAAYYAAAYAAYAADAADAAYADDAAYYDAADAAAAAAAWACVTDAARLRRAHEIIDYFEYLTGVKSQPIPLNVTVDAVTKMAAKA